MDELEKAILIQLDPTKATEVERRQAQAYTAQGLLLFRIDFYSNFQLFLPVWVNMMIFRLITEF